MEKILITGAAGFIGRNLVRALEERGSSVTPVDDLSVTPLVPPQRNQIVRRSVLQLRPADFKGVDTVVHLAAKKHVGKSFKDRSIFQHNTTTDHHLLDMVTRMRVPRVFLASSCEVYGDQGNRPLAERERLRPLSPYAVSKAAMEHLANVYRRMDPGRKITVLRLFNIYGPDENPDAVVPRFIHDVQRFGYVQIEGSGVQRRDFTYIGDAVQMLVRVIESDDPPACLNIGSGTSVSIDEIARRVVGRFSPAQVRYGSPRVNEISNFTADLGTFHKRYGSLPRTDLDRGLELCCESPYLQPSRLRSTAVKSHPVDGSKPDPAGGGLAERIVMLHGTAVALSYPAADAGEIERAVEDLPGRQGRGGSPFLLHLTRKGGEAPEGARRLDSEKVCRMSAGNWQVYQSPGALRVEYDLFSGHVLRRFLAALFLQSLPLRGTHCFHGAAVVFGGEKLVLLLGESKTGKTTLANLLAAAGCTVLTENFTLLDSEFRWRRFIDHVKAPDELCGARARLCRLVILRPGQTPLRLAESPRSDLSRWSASRYFLNIFETLPRPMRQEAAQRINGHLAAVSPYVSELTYRKDVDPPEASCEELLRAFG
jgi:nucleoside-diphosphate-sugar epimerase